MPRPIDRVRLRTELLKAAHVMADHVPGWSDAHRLGALDILLQRIAYEAGLPEVADEIATMMQARFERVMAGYRERVAALAPLASDALKTGDVSAADEVAYFDSLDGTEPGLERDRRTSEVPAF